MCRPQVHALDKSNFEVESRFSFTLFFVPFFKKEAKDSLLFSKELHYYLFSRHISTNKKILLVRCGKKMTKKILFSFVHQRSDLFHYWSEPETRIFHSYLCERFRGYSTSLFRYLCLSLCLHLWCSAISWHFLFRPDGIKTLIYINNYSVSPSFIVRPNGVQWRWRFSAGLRRPRHEVFPD